MHQYFTTTICIEVITRPYLVSFQCELSLLIWIMHLLTSYYSTNQSEIPKSSRKHLNHSHIDYTSPFSFFFLNTYGLYHNINIKLIIDDRKFVVLMVRNKLFFLLLMTIFFYKVIFPRSYEDSVYNIHSSTNYTNVRENLIDEIVNY